MKPVTTQLSTPEFGSLALQRMAEAAGRPVGAYVFAPMPAITGAVGGVSSTLTVTGTTRCRRRSWRCR